MSNSNVNRVEREQIALALEALEEVNVDAANLLRTVIRAYCVFDVDLLDMREMLLRVEARCNQLGHEAHELAMRMERVARDAEL